EDRAYKNVPRCVSRPGDPRKNLYKGPGVILAAAESIGKAYEERDDFNENSWVGAFTNELTTRAAAAIRDKRALTYADLLDDVRKFFASNTGRMPGLSTYPLRAAMSTAYQRHAFIGSAAPASQAFIQLSQKQQASETSFRLALETVPGMPSEE